MRLAHSCGEAITAELMTGHKAAGIDTIEVSVGNMELAAALDFAKTRELADEYGIELWSLHLPFLPFHVIDPSNPVIADYTVEYFCSLIDKAVEIGIKVFVVHPSGEPIAASDRPMRMECAKKSLAALAEYATAKGTVIAVEDLPRTCLGRDSSDILELISAHPDLRVCFDTNHLLGEKISDFIAKVGEKIITTHVSDYDEKNERHWLSGEGVIDWKALKDALIAIGYDGPWLYELGLGGSSSTIDRERRLEYSDFRRNYDEIMADLPITLIGKGKTDLPSWK
ncbi:MAG: sugar phosphate isomerase/epimerase [Clostridia bacterium]|nr:sugar phosphate isomerase/epimerase [Clostridia bacterium]